VGLTPGPGRMETDAPASWGASRNEEPKDMLGSGGMCAQLVSFGCVVEAGPSKLEKPRALFSRLEQQQQDQQAP
ncbi:unnamed protein product, partial [Polarella glacialis]